MKYWILEKLYYVFYNLDPKRQSCKDIFKSQYKNNVYNNLKRKNEEAN